MPQRGTPLLPNTGPFITGWDNTRYDLTAGVFVEGFAGTNFAPADWKASTTQLLGLAAKNKIIILQNYLGDASDLATRRFYLALLARRCVSSGHGKTSTAGNPRARRKRRY